MDAGIGFTVSPKLVNELYDPGFVIGVGGERRLAHSLAVTGRLGYTGLPFNSGDNPFDTGQQIQASEGQLNLFDLALGVRLGPPAIYGRVAIGGSVATGKSIDLLTGDPVNGFVVRRYDPSGSGLLVRAGLGSTFVHGQRYFVEASWAMAQAEDDIQTISLGAGALFP